MLYVSQAPTARGGPRRCFPDERRRRDEGGPKERGGKAVPPRAALREPANTALLPEEGEHRQHTPVVARVGQQIELGEDAAHVGFHRLGRHPQLLGDGLVGAALGHQREHLLLPVGQRLQRAAGPGPGHQPGDDLRVDDRLARRDPADRVGELGEVGDALLEDVANPARVARQQLDHVLGLHVLGHDQDGGAGPAPPDLQRGLEPLGGLGGRHPDVGQHDLRADLAGQPQQGGGVRGQARDLETGVGQHAFQALGEKHGVLGDDHAHWRSARGARPWGRRGGAVRAGHGHGITASSRVPPPGGLCTVSEPPTEATRSARPDSPLPDPACAPPTPSSLTSTSSRPGCSRTVTTAALAWACLATLASASDTTKYAVASTWAGNLPAGTARTWVVTGERSISAWMAPSSPVWVSTAGWMPRASSRSSAIAALASLDADSSSASRSGSAPAARSRAMPIASDRVTSRCCAPSCRSRSSRRRSASPASTIRAREARTWSSWTWISACSRACSSARLAAAAATRISSGSCLSSASWTRTASPGV